MSISFAIEQEEPRRFCIRIEGDLNIRHALEIKSCLLETLDEAESVRVDLGKGGEIDISCLQLFCSAHKYAVFRGKEFVLDPRPQHYKEVLDVAGFSRSRGCALDTNSTCLWMERGRL